MHIFCLTHIFKFCTSHIWIINPHIENYFFEHLVDNDEDDYDGCYTERNVSLTSNKLGQWSNEDLQFFGGTETLLQEIVLISIVLD
jgi:hypothetical protein